MPRTFQLIFALLLLISGVGQGQEDPDRRLSELERQTSATNSGLYLCRTLAKNGRFTYNYNPATDTVARTYNWLRHAGTIVALTQLYEATRVVNFRNAAIRSAGYLKAQVREAKVDGKVYTVLVSDPKTTGSIGRAKVAVKTGGLALGTIALLRIDDINKDQKHKELVLKFCDYMRFTQKANGDLRSKLFVDEGKWSSFQSTYYAGEALVALAMVEARYPNRKNRQTMLRLMNFLANRWDLANALSARGKVLPFDHWAMIGSSLAYPLLKDDDLKGWGGNRAWTRPALLESMVIYCGNELGRNIAKGPDRVRGSFVTQQGNLTPTAIRLEGITAIRKLVRKMGTPAQKQKLKAWGPAIARARRFMIRCQYDKTSFADRKLKISVDGAFRQAYDLRVPKNAAIQIDYCQHAMSGMLEW